MGRSDYNSQHGKYSGGEFAFLAFLNTSAFMTHSLLTNKKACFFFFPFNEGIQLF